MLSYTNRPKDFLFEQNKKKKHKYAVYIRSILMNVICLSHQTRFHLRRIDFLNLSR